MSNIGQNRQELRSLLSQNETFSALKKCNTICIGPLDLSLSFFMSKMGNYKIFSPEQCLTVLKIFFDFVVAK